MKSSVTLILGGVRSGKSRLAEKLARSSRRPVAYIATATAGDEEMQRRIMVHREQRPVAWQVVEEPLHLAAALHQASLADHCILVDCLTLWLTNLLLADDPELFACERAALLSVLPTLPAELIIVSNETNMGITPMGALSRRFCDEAGWLHQELAQLSDTVILTVAGLPHYLKRHVND